LVYQEKSGSPGVVKQKPNFPGTFISIWDPCASAKKEQSFQKCETVLT
jgi:hypothetical protein